MNISGILVVVSPPELGESIAALNALPGVEVHHTDEQKGRIVVTQEAESVEAEVEGLKRIKAAPYVIMAEMVYHFFEEDGGLHRGIPARFETTADQGDLLPYLND